MNYAAAAAWEGIPEEKGKFYCMAKSERLGVLRLWEKKRYSLESPMLFEVWEIESEVDS